MWSSTTACADFRIGPDAGGDHDDVAVERRTVLEGEPGDLALAEHSAGELAEMDLHAHRFHGRFQDRAGGGIELHLHEMAGEVHDMDLAAVVQAAGGFQAEQAAADHGSASALLGLGDDGAAVIDGAKAEHPRLDGAIRAVDARHRRDEGAAAGRDQQLVVALPNAVRGHHDLGRSVDFADQRTGMQLDVVAFIPFQRMDEYFARVLGAAENARKQDAVVVAIGLGAEHHDVESLAAGRQRLLDGARARHSVADYNELPVRHCLLIFAITIARCLPRGPCARLPTRRPSRRGRRRP
jgi:hypothetical protein